MDGADNQSRRETDAVMRSGAPAQNATGVFAVTRKPASLSRASCDGGLIPHYADARPHIQPIHARAETITEQRMFREAYHKRRCIVPMTGST